MNLKMDSNGFADIIFIKGDIITVDDHNPTAEALAVKDGKIIAVGKKEEVLRYKGNKTELIDLKGKTLMPGLIEPHSHLIMSASYYDWIDISALSYSSVEEVMGKLRSIAKKKKPGEWIVAFGWDPILLRDLPTLNADILDEISTEHPIMIKLQSMHTCWVNHKALEVSGITDEIPQPDNGCFVKDENGKLTGMLMEQGAFLPLRAAMPKADHEKSVELIKAQFKRYHLAGYTTVHLAGDFEMIPKGFEIVKDLAEGETSPLRITIAARDWEVEKTGEVKFMEESDRCKFAGVKFWYDGSPYSGGMLLDEPYLENELMQEKLSLSKNNYGISLYSLEEFERKVQKYHDAGLQIEVHSQGDRACREVIDVFEKVIEKTPRYDLRHRLEHCALLSVEDMKRMSELGIFPSFHIGHIYYYGEALRDEILGEERANRLMPVGSAVKLGLIPSLHNDSPMYPSKPFALLHAAVTRKTRNGETIGSDESITLEQAIKAITIDAAWQCFMEDEVGSLEVGKYADFVILSENPLKADLNDIDKIQVMDTYIDGLKVT